MRFSGKHVVVTGAASGLGPQPFTAKPPSRRKAFGSRRRWTGSPAPFANSRICDITDEDQVKSAFSGLSRLDAVVNSAGIARRAKVDQTEMADFDAVMAVNVRGAFLVSKYAAPIAQEWAQRDPASVVRVWPATGTPQPRRLYRQQGRHPCQ